MFLHRGTLDKFVGDMVMALFGAPLDDRDHADHAVQAALDMVDELERAERAVEGGRTAELDIGIGINTGPMIAGNIGSEAIMSYTVIGDAVNLGSRLESLNKQYGTRIIISDGDAPAAEGRYDLPAPRRRHRQGQDGGGRDFRSRRPRRRCSSNRRRRSQRREKGQHHEESLQL